MTELEQIEQLHHVFVEKYPTTKEYTDRLAEEVELISQHRFVQTLCKSTRDIRASKRLFHITEDQQDAVLFVILWA